MRVFFVVAFALALLVLGILESMASQRSSAVGADHPMGNINEVLLGTRGVVLRITPK